MHRFMNTPLGLRSDRSQFDAFCWKDVRQSKYQFWHPKETIHGGSLYGTQNNSHYFEMPFAIRIRWTSKQSKQSLKKTFQNYMFFNQGFRLRLSDTIKNLKNSPFRRSSFSSMLNVWNFYIWYIVVQKISLNYI